MEEFQKHLYVLILAGGGGTRLWPVSRDSFPKQYSKLFGNRSLLKLTYDRIKKFVGTEKIWIATTSDQVKLIRSQLPKIPLANYSIEPIRRNTAWSQGMAAAYILKQDSQAVIINLQADHLIGDVPVYRKTLMTAARAAFETGKLVAIGIKPTFHHEGYEYLESGRQIPVKGNVPVYAVKSFIRRDEFEKIEKVLKTKSGWWNGSYVWTAKAVLDEFKINEPKIYSGLQRIYKSIGTDEERNVKQVVFQMAKPLQMDFVLTGRSKNLLVVPGFFKWNDVGDWNVVWKELPKDKLGNVIEGPGGRGQYVGVDSENNLFFLNKKLIATVGLSNMVIVDTPDALLICPKDDAQGVKKIVEMLKEQKLTDYL